MIFSKRLLTGASGFYKVYASNFSKILFISLNISCGSLISLFSISSLLMILLTAFVSEKIWIILLPLHTIKFYQF